MTMLKCNKHQYFLCNKCRNSAKRNWSSYQFLTLSAQSYFLITKVRVATEELFCYVVLLLLNWSWSWSWSYTFGLGLGLGLTVLVLVLTFWSCFHHCYCGCRYFTNEFCMGDIVLLKLLVVQRRIKEEWEERQRQEKEEEEERKKREIEKKSRQVKNDELISGAWWWWSYPLSLACSIFTFQYFSISYFNILFYECLCSISCWFYADG